MDSRIKIFEAKIAEIKKKIDEKTRERGEAAGGDTNSWHDNSAFDLANEEILILHAKLQDLKEDLAKIILTSL